MTDPLLLPPPSILRLSKRELFAAMALQGLLSDPQCSAPWEPLAAVAVAATDALLAELEKCREAK